MNWDADYYVVPRRHLFWFFLLGGFFMGVGRAVAEALL